MSSLCSVDARSLRVVLLAAAALLGFLPGNSPAQDEVRVSRFGEYSGYSKEIYDSWVRTSRYLTMRDGVRLAADIMRPAREGKAVEDPLPAIWSHTRYLRAQRRQGQVMCAAHMPKVASVIKRGYVIVIVDVRGSGASFGSWQGLFTKKETQDAFEVTEWIASQPWCDGKVGMVGGSYLGITQIMAAGTKPPHLKAIFPAMSLFDFYSVTHHGGVFFDDFIRTWSELTERLDSSGAAAGVDSDDDGALLKAAKEEHGPSRALIDILLPLKFRDGKDEPTGALPYMEWNPAGCIESINESGVPLYLWCGWFDAFALDGLLMFQNFEAPRKIVMGAWPHSPRDPLTSMSFNLLYSIEQLRWFDYWLKGVDNGIMDEPAVRYHVMKSPGKSEWRAAEEWPPSNIEVTNYYFHAGPSRSVASSNDGMLGTAAPPSPAARGNPERDEPDRGESDLGGAGHGESDHDEYLVDNSTTTGQTSRWDNTVGGGFGYPDMTTNDEKALTYTTIPLDRDLEVTGHPVVHLWISSSASDGDFFVYLEEVDGKGISHYVTEGTIRASHRALHPPPYDNFGLPYHRSFLEDAAELVPGEPAELVFDLLPTSNVFNAGNRIRIAVTCADSDNAATPDMSPPPTLRIHRSAERASRIALPIIPAEKKK